MSTIEKTIAAYDIVFPDKRSQIAHLQAHSHANPQHFPAELEGITLKSALSSRAGEEKWEQTARLSGEPETDPLKTNQGLAARWHDKTAGIDLRIAICDEISHIASGYFKNAAAEIRQIGNQFDIVLIGRSTIPMGNAARTMAQQDAAPATEDTADLPRRPGSRANYSMGNRAHKMLKHWF